MGPHCWWWGPGYFFGAPWNMALGAVFWTAVVVWASVRSRGGGGGRDNALRILEERYARGEISDDELVRRKQALGGT